MLRLQKAQERRPISHQWDNEAGLRPATGSGAIKPGKSTKDKCALKEEGHRDSTEVVREAMNQWHLKEEAWHP
jgi:hypothetical protein